MSVFGGGRGLRYMFVWELEASGVCQWVGGVSDVSVRMWVHLGADGRVDSVCVHECAHTSVLVGVSSVCLCERVWPCHRQLQAQPHKLHTPAGGLRRPRVRQWEADGAGMEAIWGWGRGRIPPLEPPGSPLLAGPPSGWELELTQ